MAKIRFFSYICSMTEVNFIRTNLEKWSGMEQTCEHAASATPDELAAAYQELCADLVFAQTHYPDSRITAYLNDLTLALHVQVYRRRVNFWKKAWHFMRYEVPLTFYRCRRDLLVSLCVFLLGTAIGIGSQLAEPEFASDILGKYYVKATLENIEEGTPMAVYESSPMGDMFLSITLNNVMVSLTTFFCGVLTFFGTGLSLLNNAVMVGCFQTFFFQHGVGIESMLAIWLHGTIEISTIIVAGAAGIRLGTGWLFPESLSRMAAFRRSAKEGLKMCMGIIPLVVVAAFIEGFFTRHTEWPDGVRLSVIVLSLAIVLYYVVVLPHKTAKALPNRE